MKTTILIWAIILLAITICGGCTQTGTQDDDFITVDVTANYPHKELVLQDFMDVEYIPLETTDDFVCKGYIQAINKDFIIATNRNDDGNIYIFDRKGKALKKINRKGQGGEEYINVLNVTLDENTNEIFVNDMYAKKIVVYDLEGNFKRSFPHKKGLLYIEIYNFDKDNLICHDAINDNNTTPLNTGQSFMIVSKQNGSITKEIQIPFGEKKSIFMTHKDEASGMTYGYLPSSTLNPINPYKDDFILVELSADTLYRYLSDHTMKPFIVRTPSIQTMKPEQFLLLSLITEQYYFMEIIKKEKKFPAVDLLFDKQAKSLFRYKVYNDDYTNKETVYMKSTPLNSEMPPRQVLEAPQLLEAYEKGQLKGQLKKIAANMNPEDNPVIMLMKHKK